MTIERVKNAAYIRGIYFNINYLLKRVDGLVTANIYGSKKVANFVCNTYNNNYINAGNHAFIGPDKPF